MPSLGARQERLCPDGMVQKALQGSWHLHRSVENSWGFAGLLAPRASELVCVSWSQESEQLRVKAFLLFGKLAKVVRISKKHFFKEEVKKAWVPLMLHCQDPCSNAAQVRYTLVCVPKPGVLTVPKRKMLSRYAGLATCGFLRLTQSPREPCSHMPGWGKGLFKATHKLAYRGVSSLWELGFLFVQSPPASILQPSPFLPVSFFGIMTHSCLKLTLNLSLPAPYRAGLYVRERGCEGQQRGTWLCHTVPSPGPSPNSSTG